MKKTAKILIGVLSVGALIGTGYATWHISGGFTGDEAELLPGVETVVDKNFGYIEVTAVDGDDFINFDGDANDDLTISYMVKAFPNKGSDRDPYDLKNYEGIANEYIPNLKVETIVKEGDVELGKDDPFFDYVDLPSSAAIDYKTWLASEYKDTGYKVTLNFSWSKETLGGQNPEQAWKGLSTSEQQANYDSLIDALSNVKFTFKFIVGNDDGVIEEPGTEEPDPEEPGTETPVTPTEGEWVNFGGTLGYTDVYQVTEDKENNSYNVTYTDIGGMSYKNFVFNLKNASSYNHIKFTVKNNGENLVQARTDVNTSVAGGGTSTNTSSLNLSATQDGTAIRTDTDWGGSFYNIDAGQETTVEIVFSGDASILSFFFDSSTNDELLRSGNLTISNIQLAYINNEVEEPAEEKYKTIYIKDLKGLNNFGSQTFIYAWNSKDATIQNASYPGIKMDTYCWNVFDDEASIFKTELNIGKYTDFLISSFLNGNNPYAEGAQPNGKTRDISISELGDNDFVKFSTIDDSSKLYDVTFDNFDKAIDPYKANINLTYDETKGSVSFENKEHFKNETMLLNIEPNSGCVIKSVTLNGETVEIGNDGKYYVTLTNGDNNIEVIFEDTIKYGTLELTNNEYVAISATIDGEAVTTTQLPVGTTVTLNFETLVDNYEIEDVLLNDTTSIYNEGSSCSFEIVEGTNKITVVGKTIATSDAFSNPKVVEPSEIVNTENESTYFETTCLVSGLRNNGFYISDPNNLDLKIDCNLLYSTEEKLIDNSEYIDGKYKVIKNNESSDKFDADSLDVGDLVKVRGFTNSTGYFKGVLLEKVKDSSEIDYDINVTCEEGGSVTASRTAAPVNTEITLDITCPANKEIDTVTLNGSPLSTENGSYKFLSSFVNNIVVTFKDVGVLTYQPLVIDVNSLKSIEGSYGDGKNDTLNIIDSDGNIYPVEFSYFACSQKNKLQFKDSSYIKNLDALPAEIDYIKINDFTDANNNELDVTNKFLYSFSETTLDKGEFINESDTLNSTIDNAKYFALNSNYNRSFRVSSFTIYFK